MLNTGAQVARLPICALAWKEDAPVLPLDHLQLWDCFSYDVAVTEYEYLKGIRCSVCLKDRTWVDGTYQYTIDWYGSRYAEDAGEGGHKCAHFIQLDNGLFAALPNNRIFWREPSFITQPLQPGDRPDYLTNSHTWKCERDSKWATEDSDRYFYDLQTVEGKS